MTRQSFLSNALFTTVLSLVSLHHATARAEPEASDATAPDETTVDASVAADWSQLSPEAYRAARDRKEPKVTRGVQRREARERPDWLVLDDPNSVSKADANRVHRGGMLLAAGIPATIAGAFAVGFGAGNECSQGFVGSGAFMMTLGMGLNIGGIIAFARASKEARGAKRSRKHTTRMSGMAAGSALASTVLIMGPGIAGVIGCD